MIQKWKQLDRGILFIVLCFGALSTVLIYSATFGTKYEGMHVNNIMMFLLFFVLLFGSVWFDYRLLTGTFAYVLYGIGVLLLVVLRFVGEGINGSVRWIDIGPVQFQPSELMKVFTILLIAHLLSKRNGDMLRLFQDVLPICIVAGIPFLLVLKQPDLGTALTFISILIGMLWIGNIRKVHLIAGLSAIGAAVTAVLWLFYNNKDLLESILKPHQMARIETFLDPTSDPTASWHVRNAIKAVASGQLSGQGLQQGQLVQNGFIPYSYSDSIFVAVGEEFGFIGAAVLLLLYFLLIYQLIRIVIESVDLSGAYMIVGIIAMLVLQIFENIAMHIGLMPLTGIALPFISYGGSSLLTNMICIGLILSVKAYHAAPRLGSV